MQHFHRTTACLLAPVILSLGCSQTEEVHIHEPGVHGGIIVAVGQDHYHAEILFADGQMRMYMLDQDQAKVVEIETQEIEAYIRPFGDSQAYPIKLNAEFQTGDTAGNSSLFVGNMPKDLPPLQLLVNVPMIQIHGTRYRFSFATAEPIMPSKVTNDEERQLYLEPGGLYTLEDIKANGSQTASQKFANFMSSHDMNPQPGARICPVTSTLANADCSWIINGQEYLFCCPPCVDEFLKRAKTDPKSIAAADTYVK